MPPLNTEHSLQRYHDAELWPAEEALAAMLDSQAGAIAAVRGAIPALALAVQAAAARLVAGGRFGTDGRLVYAGAGASGRLAVQDGVELHPTFGWPHARLAYLVAGGDAALVRSVEGAEDDAAAGRTAAEALRLRPADVVVAVAASGRTPFTVAVQQAAHDAGALTVALAGNPGSPLLLAADHPLALPTGAEFLAGSTRLAAGTAQKIALNLFSTRLMTELGRVYHGLMVHVVASNEKLVQRAQGIVAALTGADPETAAHAYEVADRDIPLAVLMLDGHSRTVAQGKLDAAGGNLRRARGG